ncbi:MAG TPA: hypothetical protein VGC27_00360 [Rhizomicrobium sp.]
MRRCTRCVLPDSFPGISFNNDGVCSYCTTFDAQASPRAAPGPLHDTVLLLMEASKGQAKRYDAVVAFSGGKDSTFLLQVLKARFGLRLLAVTFDNGFLSKACTSNMRNVLTALDIDHLIIAYRRDHMNAAFTASALSRVYPDHLAMFGSGVCISCIRMVLTAVLRTAIEKRIPMVMLGNSPGQILRSASEILYRDNTIPFAVRKALFAKLAERTGDWVYHYVMLDADEYKTTPFPYIVNPLPVLGYDEAEIYRTIAGLGWSKPADVDPNSTNCRLNAFGTIQHKNIYGFHPYDYEMSQLVRLGSLSGEAALERLTDPADTAIAIAADVEREVVCHGCKGGR